jgi:hypothetical protein
MGKKKENKEPYIKDNYIYSSDGRKLGRILTAKEFEENKANALPVIKIKDRK